MYAMHSGSVLAWNSVPRVNVEESIQNQTRLVCIPQPIRTDLQQAQHEVDPADNLPRKHGAEWELYLDLSPPLR